MSSSSSGEYQADHEVDESFDHSLSAAASSEQVVDVVQTLSQVVLPASGSSTLNSHDSAICETFKQCAALVRV